MHAIVNVPMIRKRRSTLDHKTHPESQHYLRKIFPLAFQNFLFINVLASPNKNILLNEHNKNIASNKKGCLFQ